MPRFAHGRFGLLCPWILIVALTACLPSCATNRDAKPHSPAADDLDLARSDFDRHTPPGGD